VDWGGGYSTLAATGTRAQKVSMRWTLLTIILAQVPASISVAQSWSDYANRELDMRQSREVEKQAKLAGGMTVWEYLKWLDVDMETGEDIGKRAKGVGMSVFDYIKLREGEYSLVDPTSPTDAAAYARDMSGLSAKHYAVLAQERKRKFAEAAHAIRKQYPDSLFMGWDENGQPINGKHTGGGNYFMGWDDNGNIRNRQASPTGKGNYFMGWDKNGQVIIGR
jgi:hypothetical protein